MWEKYFLWWNLFFIVKMILLFNWILPHFPYSFPTTILILQFILLPLRNHHLFQTFIKCFTLRFELLQLHQGISRSLGDCFEKLVILIVPLTLFLLLSSSLLVCFELYWLCVPFINQCRKESTHRIPVFISWFLIEHQSFWSKWQHKEIWSTIYCHLWIC